MKHKTFVLDGNNFNNLHSFYREVEKKLTKDLDWKIGRNLDAFNDILWGGFGAFDFEEPIDIVWEHSRKSKSDLGYPETIRWLEEKLKECHPSHIPSLEKELERLKDNNGPTLFDMIIEIVKEHENITLKLR